jgi:hypothetical protein
VLGKKKEHTPFPPPQQVFFFYSLIMLYMSPIYVSSSYSICVLMLSEKRAHAPSAAAASVLTYMPLENCLFKLRGVRCRGMSLNWHRQRQHAIPFEDACAARELPL